MARILKRGATLAEAVLALGLSVVVILVTVALGITAARSNQKGTDLALGCSWGGQVLEQFVTSLPPANDPFWGITSYASPYQTDSVQLGATPYQANLFVSELPGMGAGLKLVTVNVTWNSGASRAGYGQQRWGISRIIYGH